MAVPAAAGEDCNYTGGASGFDNGEWRM